MKLGRREREILIGVLSDIETILNEERNYGPWREANALATEGVVALNAANWLSKKPTKSDSVLNSRSYKKLEDAGLIVKRRLGYDECRLTHLQLTEAGKVAARELLGAAS